MDADSMKMVSIGSQGALMMSSMSLVVTGAHDIPFLKAVQTCGVLLVSGHRVGTAEIENLLDHHPAVAEAAVVGYPHEIKVTTVIIRRLPYNVAMGHILGRRNSVLCDP
jgi:acyl-CoA synthetase (AMP-forming)/AMP-acid ligase II